MKYYIDFDSTLFNTSGLVETMLKTLSTEINKQNNLLTENDMFLECKKMFNSQNIHNIFELCKYFANKYKLNTEVLIDAINKVIDNGENFVYKDAIDFLKKTKQNSNILNLLTYTTQDNIEWQIQKVKGSGLLKYFDNIIIASTSKWELDLDYSKGIFIDDNPTVLAGLFSKNPQKVIRIKRDGNKYSSTPMPDNIIIPEFDTLQNINLKEEK